MITRDLQNIAAVIQHLEKHEEFREVKEVELGVGKNKQVVVTVNGVIITTFDNNGKPLLPLTDAEKLRSMTKQALNLQESDSVNTQADEHHHQRTLLIQATLGNEQHLVKALLDHGADPSLSDSEGNNAFMHAAKNGYSDILKDFMTLIQTDTHQAAQDKKNQDQTEKAAKEAAPAPSAQKTETRTTEAAPKASKQQSEKTSLRIRLDPSVLVHKNKHGETAESLALQYKERFALKVEIVEEENPKNKRKAPAEEKATKIKTPLDRLKELTDDLHALRPDKVVTEKSKEAATLTVSKPKNEVRSAANETAENITLNRAYEEKLAQARHTYDGFYLKKLSFFSVKSRELAATNTAQIAAFQAREALRKKHGLILLSTNKDMTLDELQEISERHNFEPILIKNENQFSIYGHASGGWQITSLEEWQLPPLKENKALLARFKTLNPNSPVLIDAHDTLLTGDPLIDPNRSLTETIKAGHLETLNADKKRDFELKFRGKQPVLPVSYQDQAKLRAAFSLLKDYYAPEKAPLPHFLQWNALRRLLTFHTGRRYCKQAEELYKSLETAPLDHVHDFMRVAKDLEKELRVMRGFMHDKNNQNSLFNSSYTRRLEYILQTLKKTEAYEQATNQLPTDTYLDVFDIKYPRLR